MTEVLTKVQKKKELSLDLDNNLFAELILNFLGKKEKLSYKADISYILRLNDIEQFYYLVNAKIEKEQTVHIEHFLVNFTYSDGTTREISGIESLNGFHEIRDVECTDITLTWNILIKYPNADTIENQTIELSFIINEKNEHEGRVVLSINHTNQSWAIEILNLLKTKIVEVTEKHPKTLRTSMKIIDFFTLDDFIRVVFPLFMLISTSVALLMLPTNKGSEYYYDVVESINTKSQNTKETMVALLSVRNMNSNDIMKVADNLITDPKLSNSLQKIAKVKEKSIIDFRKNFFLILASIIAFFASIYFYLKKTIEYYGRDSFIIMNPRTEKEYTNYINSKNKMEYYSLSFILVAIVCGAIGNLVYSFLKL